MRKLDRRARRTRRLLRQSLHDLIREKDYDTITVQDITDRADLSRATFYLHYKDKDELLARSLEDMFDDLVGHIYNRPPEDLLQDGGPPALIAFQHAQEYSDVYRMLLGDRGVTSVINRVRQYLAQQAHLWIEKVIPPGTQPEIPVTILAHHLSGSLFELIVWWINHDMPYPAETMAEQFKLLALPSVMMAIGISPKSLTDPFET